MARADFVVLKKRVEVVDSGLTSVEGRADAVERCNDLVDDRSDRNVERYMILKSSGVRSNAERSPAPKGDLF